MDVLSSDERAARLYDAIHDAEGKDYARESKMVVDLVNAHVANAESLLDVACGTGRHLEQFSRHLRCAGIDNDAGMLAVARARCPNVPLTQADMVDFDLGTQFDVVTCLFSAVGYAMTTDRLNQAVVSMARHLRPGGVLIVEPWFQPEQWFEGYLSMSSVDQPELKAARISISRRKGDIAVMDFHYLVGSTGRIDSFIEHHELALFSWDQYRSAFEHAGLEPDIDESGLIGRGLVLGQVRTDP